MKKIALVAVLLVSLHGVAQKSFEKGTNVIGLGADLGYYNYTSTIASTAESESNPALNKMLHLQYEHGVANWLGIGAKIQLCDYFTERDSVTGAKPQVRALDATLLVNAHFIRAKYVNMLIGVNGGYSTLNWEARDQAISNATGGGFTFDVHLQPRFYFGKHVGMFLNLAYTNYSYKDLDFDNTYTHISDILDLKGGGVNFGLGLQAKF